MRTLNPLNKIITGIPRSGTSLICYLLNQCNDIVALSEPTSYIMSQVANRNNSIEICRAVQLFFEQMRKSILTEGIAISKHINGEIPDNYFGIDKNENGIRKSHSIAIGQVAIHKVLSQDFILCVKDPLLFSLLLPILVRNFDCYAMVRNPLAVLSSWNSVDIPLGEEIRNSFLELDPNLIKTLLKIETKLQRQLYLLSWFYKTYHCLLSPQSILRYEDMIESPDKTLSLITSWVSKDNIVLENKNRCYDKNLLNYLAKELLESDGYYWLFYQKSDIISLL